MNNTIIVTTNPEMPNLVKIEIVNRKDAHKIAALRNLGGYEQAHNVVYAATFENAKAAFETTCNAMGNKRHNPKSAMFVGCGADRVTTVLRSLAIEDITKKVQTGYQPLKDKFTDRIHRDADSIPGI